MLHILVLGAAAGGGFPQWNSNDAVARRVRAGDPDTPPRTQSSIAVSADGKSWALFNASPDLRQQIHERRQLQGRAFRRNQTFGLLIIAAAILAWWLFHTNPKWIFPSGWWRP